MLVRDKKKQIQRTAGVVAIVKGEGASKSRALSEALAANKQIVAFTMQTFPFTLQHIQELAATKNKRFAVIADEAHSSKTNETARIRAELKNILPAPAGLYERLRERTNRG
ncbi:hypothetical protein [Acidithiobacillus sp.]|uniref:hypothetical protein n=1 Tax=Acidithiobacillus sp. TaxID=1872118 RepID=UPI002621324F|nr:hypothetical protein [Acidithiobacillus sp.]